MDLLDRYLAAVAALLPKAHLPKNDKWDIVAELRDLLLNQMEEKEAALGRPLTEAEREAVLRAFGHPIAVAGRFGPSQALIGPELYPFYVFGVKAALVLAAFVTALPLMISLITGHLDGGDLISRFLSGFIGSALSLIGAATVLAAAIERGWIPLGKSLDWKVADLPRLDRPPFDGTLPDLSWLGRRGLPGETRFEAALEAAASGLFILWWTGAVTAPWTTTMAVSPDGLFLRPAAIWTSLYWPILALAAVQLLCGLTGMARPGWTRLRAAIDAVGSVGGLGLTAVLWQAGRLVEVASDGAAGLDARSHLQAALDQAFEITLVVMAVINAGKLAVDLWRVARGGPARPIAVS